MDRESVVKILQEHHRELGDLGVKSLALFGSVARGEDHQDSDMDFLVEFDGPATFDQYMELKFLLQELLEKQVDLVTQRALRPQLRISIESDAVYVA